MFEFIRTHQRLMQLVLLILIVPSFVVVGAMGDINMFGNNGNTVAEVAGYKISKEEMDAAQRQQMDRMRQMFGEQFDPKMLDTPEARQGILDSLITQKVIAAEAIRNNLSVSDQTLQQILLDMPELKTPDGKFDNEKYKSLLAAQGTTPAMYEASLRQNLIHEQVNAAIQSTAFAPKSVATHLIEIIEQEREAQELAFKTSDYLSQVKITDEMLKDYYNKNGAQFQTPEQAKAEYVVLDSAAAESQIAVTDADIKSYYDQNAKRYSVEEQRRASHILIAVNKDASAADKAAAKAKAQKLLDQVRKNPADFAKLAKENSQDPSSAERGGDLDFFGRGLMVKPFEDAAYKLKQGEISDLVESDFGYHIIQVTAVKPGATKPFDEVKAEIAAEIKKQLAAKKFAELSETFRNTVYEQADSLKPVADKLKLKIETAANLTRGPNPAAAKMPFNDAKFLQALFADDVIKSKHNTEAIEVAPNTLIAGRIVEYKAASKRPFEEVKAVITEQVTQAEAAKLAKKAGEAKLAELKTKGGTASFTEGKMVSRTQQQGLPSEAVTEIMKANVTKLPAYVGVELPALGYNVYRINKVAQPANLDSARRQADQQRSENLLAQQEMTAYLDALKKKAKVEIINKQDIPAPQAETKDARTSK